MIIPSSLRSFRSRSFVMWSGGQGTVIVRKNLTITLIPLYGRDFDVPFNLSNLQLCLNAIVGDSSYCLL